MYNHLIKDMSRVRDEEIEEKITKLSKMFAFYSSRGDANIASQLLTTIHHLQFEQQNRHRKNMEEAIKSTPGLNEFINVG